MDHTELAIVVREVLKQLGIGPSEKLVPEFYSIKDAAIVTSLSSETIRRSVTGGTLVASDLGTRDHPLYRISRQNLLLWMKERESGAMPPRKTSMVVTPSRHHKPKKKRAVGGDDHVN